MAGNRGHEASKRVISETKRLYGDLLAEPLDDRQLARPSFKLIQSVVKSLITETRTLRDVFNSTDFESDNKTLDKRNKIEFVQKLIDFSANHKQPVVGCVSAKIVANLEPNKTHELLQALAKIAAAKLRDQEPNRPRTFTKQLHGSGSPPKTNIQVTRKVVGTSGRGQSETRQRHVATILVGDEKGSPQTRETAKPVVRRASNENRSRLGSTIELSSKNHIASVANDVATNVPRLETGASKQSGESRLSSQQDAQDAQDEKLDSLKSSTAYQISTSGTETTPTVSGTSKPLSDQFVLTSDSDISKHLPHLRASLRILNPVLMDINRWVGFLKIRLADE